MTVNPNIGKPEATLAIGPARPGRRGMPEPHVLGKRGTAAEAVIRTLVRHPAFGDGTGFHFLSGNTGSNEGPIWQAIQDVTGLGGLVHGATEFIACCMASGFEVYANARNDKGLQKIPVLALHAQVGVKYGAAGIDFLMRQRQPCLLLIGDAGRLARAYGGHNSVPDYEGMLRQLGVKSVHFPDHAAGPRGLVPAVEAAMRAALTEPFGPVAVILDEDVLNAVVHADPAEVETPLPKGATETGAPNAEIAAEIGRAADLLKDKTRPVIVINQEIGRSAGARAAAERLARLTGAHVAACYAPGTVFDRGHPSWCGNLTFGESEGVAREIASYDPDVVLVVGGPFPNNVWPNGKSEVPDGVPSIVISPDETDRTRCNIVPDVFIGANVGIALKDLCDRIEPTRTLARQDGAADLLASIARGHRAELAARIAAYEAHMDDVPIHPARVAKELALALRRRVEDGTLQEAQVAIFDEALTSSPPFLDYIRHLDLHRLYYYGTPGPTLGAHGGSLGFQAAAPDNLVVSLFGDGGADFNDAAFIVCARENMPVKHLLIDNGGYELVSVNFARDARLRGESEAEQLAAGQVLPLNIQSPVHQNRALQVRGFVHRDTRQPVFGSAYVERPDQVGPAIAEMLDSKGPFLMQVIAQGRHFQPLAT